MTAEHDDCLVKYLDPVFSFCRQWLYCYQVNEVDRAHDKKKLALEEGQWSQEDQHRRSYESPRQKVDVVQCLMHVIKPDAFVEHAVCLSGGGSAESVEVVSNDQVAIHWKGYQCKIVEDGRYRAPNIAEG